MSYIENNLMPNEKILYSAKVHPFIFLPGIISFLGTIVFVIWGLLTKSNNGIDNIFMFLIAGMFLLLTFRIGIEAVTIMATTEFAVTNRRVIAKSGFIHRRTLEMLLPKIESVAVYQHILGRLTNFGTVTVTGTGGTKESFKAIIDPISVRKKINQIIEKSTQVNNQPAN